jgi:hypothetical protein
MEPPDTNAGDSDRQTNDSEAPTTTTTATIHQNELTNEDPAKPTNSRLHWPRINPVTIEDGPNQKVRYPFLTVTSPQNQKDLVFLRQLKESKPYSCKYGTVTTAWQKLVSPLEQAINVQTSQPVFEKSINAKALIKRFQSYMEFAEKFNDAIQEKSPSCQYVDNENPTEILLIIQELYKEWISNGKKMFQPQKRVVITTQTNRKQLQQQDPQSTAMDVDCESSMASSSSDSSSSSSNSTTTTTSCSADEARPASKQTKRTINHMDNLFQNLEQRMQSLENSLNTQAAAKLLKQQNKKRKLDLETERLQFEKQVQERRLQLEEEKFADEKKDRDAQRQLILALIANLQSNRAQSMAS